MDGILLSVPLSPIHIHSSVRSPSISILCLLSSGSCINYFHLFVHNIMIEEIEPEEQDNEEGRTKRRPITSFPVSQE